MLYDKRWNAKADPFSLEALISWLKKQPAEKKYHHGSLQFCLLAQFIRHTGVSNRNAIKDKSWELGILPPFATVAFGASGAGPYTFGAALTRARALAKR